MGFLSYLFYGLDLLLQVTAIIHFFRRRPEQYWFYVILFFGPLGAAVYLILVAAPDFGFSGFSFGGSPRARRIAALEAMIRDNPSPANCEELGDLFMDDRNFQSARAAFDKAIAGHSVSPDSFYRRGLCALALGDAAAALPDLERVVLKDPGYDFYRAAGLLAQAYALTGNKQKAEALFRQVTLSSTLSETYLNFADLLAAQGRTAEAREWAQKVLNKEPTMPGHLRRRERPWFNKASEILKRLPA